MTLGFLPFRARPIAWCGAFLLLFSTFASNVFAEDGSLPDELKRQADRWIELERRTAEERNDWKADREALLLSRDVLLKERDALKDKFAANDVAARMFLSRVEKSKASLTEHEAAFQALNSAYDDLERRISILATRLPDPLKEKIDPLLDMLDAGEGPEPKAVSQRTQAITSILSAIDQFNNSLTLSHTLRPDASGQMRDFKVLYWGLAVAYAADGSGRDAWVITPGEAGWEWNEANAYAGAIRNLFQVYEKERSPEMVVLPVSMKGGLQ